MESEKKPAVSNVGAWAMNVVSSVGIIMVNKQLMSPAGYAFVFATSLTGFHFSITALVGWISNATGISVSKQVPLWELLWFSIVANMSITSMNLSLMLNSVGFYQISKLSIIPMVCLMEWILNHKHYSTRVIVSVVVVAFGVGICTVTDVDINVKGFVCACVAVFCTSLQQIKSCWKYINRNHVSNQLKGQINDMFGKFPKLSALNLLFKTKVADCEKKIAAGKLLTCPVHKCHVCKQGENREVEESQFAVCRRCRKSYHRKRMPRYLQSRDKLPSRKK